MVATAVKMNNALILENRVNLIFYILYEEINFLLLSIVWQAVSFIDIALAKYDELFYFFWVLKNPKTKNFWSYHYLAFIHNWLLDLTPGLSRETHIHLVQRQLLRPNS